MSRNARYSIRIEKPDGTPLSDYGRRVRVIMTPASNAFLTAGHPIVELPWQAFLGTDLKVSGGWKEKVLSIQEELTAKFLLDLSEMTGSELIEAARSYFINPCYVNGGSVATSGGYFRRFDTYNLIEVFDDNGDGTEPWRLVYAGVQVRASGTAFEVSAEGSVELEVQCVDLITWALRTALPVDLAAWAIEKGTSVADGPYRRCFSTIYWEGARRYGHAHGDHPANWDGWGATPRSGPRRELTFYPLSYVYEAIGGVTDHVMRELVRGRSTTAAVFVVHGTPLDHWSTFYPNHTATYDHKAAGGTPPPSVLGAVRMLDEDDVPSAPVHGFFFAGRQSASRDTVGSWPNLWQFLKDTTEGLVGKIRNSAASVSVDNMPDIAIWFHAIKAPTGIPAAPLALSPASFNSTPKVTPSAGAITTATASVPAGGSRDQSKIELGDISSGETEKGFAVPRTWHTLPTIWPEPERRYYTVDSELICYVFTPGVNCLTLWTKVDDAPFFSEPEYVRIHQHVGVSDGDATTYADLGGAYTMPTPSPIGDYFKKSEDGDKDFGQRLIEVYLQIQMHSGVPHVAAVAMLGLFGSPTDYETDVTVSEVSPWDLGNRCDATLFPSGNALLDGESYLGELKGAPLVASIECDLLLGTVEKLRLEGL